MNPINIYDHKGAFFKVLQQTNLSQIGTMTIPAGQDGGPKETHSADQIFYVVEGEAEIDMAGTKHHLGGGSIITVPANTEHHVYNPGGNDLFVLTIYTPPQY